MYVVSDVLIGKNKTKPLVHVQLVQRYLYPYNFSLAESCSIFHLFYLVLKNLKFSKSQQEQNKKGITNHVSSRRYIIIICNNNLIPGNSTQCKPLYLSDDPPCVAPRLCGGFACGNREHGQNRSIHSHIHHIHHMQQHIHRHTHTHLETTQYPRSTFLRQALLRVQKL